MGKSYKGDIGTLIQVDVGADLTDATTTNLKVKKPSGGDADTWPATITTPKTLGLLEYSIQASDFDEVGVYILIAEIDFSDGGHFAGEPARFTVFDLFTDELPP